MENKTASQVQARTNEPGANLVRCIRVCVFVGVMGCKIPPLIIDAIARGIPLPIRYHPLTTQAGNSSRSNGRHCSVHIETASRQHLVNPKEYCKRSRPAVQSNSFSFARREEISAGTSHQHQSVTDYAKPNQGTSHYQSTLTTVSTTEHLPPSSDQLDSMLGNLTADMSRQGVNTTQKGCCNACDKPIVGQVITALGKTWHPEHFTCSHCNQELGTRNFFERDGNPYCEPDYHNLFSPRCAYCNGPILDKCVTALEKTWHTEHFFCAQCGQQFGEDGFHERDGKPYCRNDYFDMFAPKCNGCNRAIMENYISALNSQWHPDCFVCRDCSNPVTGKSFYAMEGKPVCPGCVGADEDE